MKLPPLFSFHILRLYPAKSGVISVFSQQLTAVRGHHKMYPYPEKSEYVSIDLSRLTNETYKNPNYKETDEYKELVAITRQEANKQFAEKIRKNAYYLNNSYSANGKLFSYAQRMANKTKSCVIGIKGERSGKDKEENTTQQVFFQPQGKIKAVLCSMGNFIFGK